MSRLFNIIICSTFWVISLNVASAMAASIHIIAAGGGNFLIEGTAMDGVAGVQFDLSYPAANQAGPPTVAKGNLVGSAMFAANTSTPGSLRVAAISTTPFSGNGIIATVTFENMPEMETPTIMSYNMIDSKGKAITPDTIGNTAETGALTGNQGITPDNQANQAGTAGNNTPDDTQATTVNSTKTASAPLPSNTVPAVLGSVTMPGDTTSPAEKTVTPDSTTPPLPTVDATPTPIAEPPETVTEKPVVAEKIQEQQQTIYSSVLDRFKNYKGEQSPAIMAALFAKPVTTQVMQLPVITISNGIDTATIEFTLASSETTAPNFALTGAKMLNLSNSKENPSKWILEVLPQKDSLNATITMITGKELIEYPLTIVPTAKEITDKETDFALFLQDTGTKAPRRDLNGDGVHDYQDNYIYTAYYLLLQQSKEKGPPFKEQDKKKTGIKKRSKAKQ